MNMPKRRFAAVSNISLPVIVTALTLLAATSAASQTEEESLWEVLLGGEHIALLRHALAPGIGDPQNFSLDDCDTQRNLSSDGRLQAVRIGKRFRSHKIITARVYSSQWCRCLETARLLEIGRVKELSLLNSFYREPEQRQTRTQALKHWIATQTLNKPVVLVTHQVNITALTGIVPASGEIVVVRRSTNDGLTLVGTIDTP